MEQLPCKAALSKSEERLGSYRRDEHLFGPDWRTAFAGVGLATALSAIFLFLIANASPPSIAAIGSLLWMFVVGAWFLAATTHPGIIARSDEISAEDAAHVAQLRRDVVMPDGRVMPMRWCYHCRVFRPPRAVHCPDCNVCVMRFDHHCPWISQCVGQRNYKYFFAYLWSLTLLCCYTGAFLTVYAFGFWASIDRRALVRQIGGQRDAVLYNGLLIVAVALGVLIGAAPRARRRSVPRTARAAARPPRPRSPTARRRAVRRPAHRDAHEAAHDRRDDVAGRPARV